MNIFEMYQEKKEAKKNEKQIIKFNKQLDK